MSYDRPRRFKTNVNKNTLSTHWIYGFHTVLAALKNPKRKIKRLVTSKNFSLPPIEKIEKKQILAENLSNTELKALLPEGSVHQGIACLVDTLRTPTLECFCENFSDIKNACVIILDQVTDPQNIGAVIRSAAFFGAQAVIVKDRNTPPITGVIAKAASGGLEKTLLIRTTNISRAINLLKQKGFWCIGFDSGAKTNFESLKISQPTGIVLGAEGYGLRKLVRQSCDQLVKIQGNGELKDLNISNAAAIALYEIKKGIANLSNE